MMHSRCTGRRFAAVTIVIVSATSAFKSTAPLPRTNAGAADGGRNGAFDCAATFHAERPARDGSAYRVRHDRPTARCKTRPAPSSGSA